MIELKISTLCFQVQKVIIEVQILKNIDNIFNHILSRIENEIRGWIYYLYFVLFVVYHLNDYLYLV